MKLIYCMLGAGLILLTETKIRPTQATADADDYDPYDDGEYPSDDDYLYGDDDDPVLTDDKPTALSDFADLLPPYFDVSPMQKTVVVGETVTLPCNAKNLKDNNIIMWQNQTQSLTQGRIVLTHRSRISLGKNFELQISKADQYDSGPYSCVILPQGLELVHYLRVVEADLYITSGDKDLTNGDIVVKEGVQLEFRCSKPGGDNTEIKWSRNGERVTSGLNGIQVQNGSIIIPKVDHHHHGLYQCIADNGEETPPHAWVDLTVMYKPIIGIKRHYVNAAIGDTAELYCTYHANDAKEMTDNSASINWSKERTLLKNNENKYEIRNNENMEAYKVNHTVLFVKKIDSSDFGEYECIVRNKLGSDTGKVHLIQEPEPAHFENKTIEGRRATIQWLTKSKQLLSEAVLDYRIHGSERWMTETISTPQHQGSGSWKLQHQVELTPGTWHVRIKTRNIAGWSKFSKDETLVIEDSQGDKVQNTRIPNDQLQAASIGGGNGSATKTTSFVALGYSITSLLVISTLVPWFGLC
ncbi:unnamed protein product [Hermetia illucens]|uniref:Ig-like domain-containing protein n=1 Tax=Hermetia illucens TaxID=343691 RepID=A0A7R8UYA4_HERIL|nr:protein amalgam-like isoform X2 [Hermetia illucens]CAD7089242.1 unnamed protein product [Hermetia illucens]